MMARRLRRENRAMSITLYGIKNCDTVRAARRWLEQHNIEHRFQDVRDDALNAEQLQQWLAELGCDKLVNKRSTTWKQLSEAQRQALDDTTAVTLLLEHPTLMKRPLLDAGNERVLGFKADQYQRLFTHHTL